MEFKRKKKEYKMENVKGISLKYGSTNRTNPQVLYITGKAWVKPTIDVDYADSLGRIRKRMERRILERLRTIESLDTKYIFDFSLSPLNMKVGKPKFMTFNIFLKQKKESMRNVKNAGKLLDSTIVPLIDEMAADFNNDYFVLKGNKNTQFSDEE